MKTINLMFFHLKTFSRNSYFIFNVLLSTISIILLQYLLSLNSTSTDYGLVWKRASLVGIWASVVTSAGVINYQRGRATLKYLVSSPTNSILSMVCLTVPASIFGLVAVPTSMVFSLILGVGVKGFDWNFVLSLFMFLVSAISTSLLISVSFIYTKNAILYEPFISIPIILVSGIFYNIIPKDFYYLTDILIPLGAPSKLIQGINYNLNYLVWSLSCLINIALYLILMSRALIKSKKDNGLGEF